MRCKTTNYMSIRKTPVLERESSIEILRILSEFDSAVTIRAIARLCGCPEITTRRRLSLLAETGAVDMTLKKKQSEKTTTTMYFVSISDVGRRQLAIPMADGDPVDRPIRDAIASWFR